MGTADGNSAMVAKFTADALVVLHFGFILFVVLGGLLVAVWHASPGFIYLAQPGAF